MNPIYTAEALSTGEGRSGHVRSSDGRLDFDLTPPKEMEGSGEGTNPEQLFAAGYAACFHSALLGVAQQAGKDISSSTVGAKVSIGKGDGGFDLAVTLEVVIPELDHDDAQDLANKAHQMCPYSRATRDNIPVDVVVSDD